MTFKEQVALDNRAVFLNNLEFADEHNLNGDICQAIMQNVSITGDSLAASERNAYPGIYQEHLLINCLESDLTEIPVSGQGFEVDGELYLVESCVLDLGMLSITLVANER